MDKQDVQRFLNKRVQLVCVFGIDSPSIYYTGTIVGVNDECLVIHDKFNRDVSISLDSIKKVEEWLD